MPAFLVISIGSMYRGNYFVGVGSMILVVFFATFLSPGFWGGAPRVLGRIARPAAAGFRTIGRHLGRRFGAEPAFSSGSALLILGLVLLLGWLIWGMDLQAPYYGANWVLQLVGLLILASIGCFITYANGWGALRTFLGNHWDKIGAMVSLFFLVIAICFDWGTNMTLLLGLITIKDAVLYWFLATIGMIAITVINMLNAWDKVGKAIGKSIVWVISTAFGGKGFARALIFDGFLIFCYGAHVWLYLDSLCWQILTVDVCGKTQAALLGFSGGIMMIWGSAYPNRSK